MIKTFICLCALLGCVLPVWAIGTDTYVVDQVNGPYKTIQAAVDAAEAGAHDGNIIDIYVRYGIYDERVHFSGVSAQKPRPLTCEILCDVDSTGVQSVTLLGFDTTNVNYSMKIQGAVISTPVAFTTPTTRCGIYVNSNTSANTNSVWITHCRFENIHGAAVLSTGGGQSINMQYCSISRCTQGVAVDGVKSFLMATTEIT